MTESGGQSGGRSDGRGGEKGSGRGPQEVRNGLGKQGGAERVPPDPLRAASTRGCSPLPPTTPDSTVPPGSTLRRERSAQARQAPFAVGRR
nr:hypothetical protein KPHV_44850 [Kitasatospora purpeofusca]